MDGQHATIQKASTYRQDRLDSAGQGHRKKNTRWTWEELVSFMQSHRELSAMLSQ